MNLFKTDTPEIIQLGTLTVPVIRNARRKRLSLEISTSTPQGVVIRAPQRMLLRTIYQFVVQKEDWIHQHLAQLPSPKEKHLITNGTKLPFLAAEITLLIQHGQRGKATLKDNQLTLPVVQSKLPLTKTINNKLITWYKQQALQHISQRSDYFSKKMHLHPQGIKVRDYKRRWGSCDHQGHLSFNWRLVMAPTDIIDYVVIHELAHLQEFNHSKRFWQIVEQQMPEWRQRKDWLNTFGADLYLI